MIETKKFKITLPEQTITPDVIEKRNKAMFNEDLEREGILAKVFIFVYINQPCSVTDITKKMFNYYHIDYNRTNVFRALKKLTDHHILYTTTSGDVLYIPESERNKMQREVMMKYHNFIKNIPDSFKKNFSNINYFWVANGEGYKYIEWCCKILNFNCEIGGKDE